MIDSNLRRAAWAARFVSFFVLLLWAAPSISWGQLTPDQTRDLEFALDAQEMKKASVTQAVRDSFRPLPNNGQPIVKTEGTGSIRVQVVWRNGKPVSDKRIVVTCLIGRSKRPSLERSGRTNKSGKSLFKSVPAGFVRVTCFPFCRPREAIVLQGQTTPIRLVLDDSRMLKGTVLDLDAKPVPDASIWLLRDSGMAKISTTDKNGQFNLQGFPFDGDIEASHPNFAPSASQHPIELLDGEPTKVVLVLQAKAGSINGVVKNTAGAAMKDIKVVVSSGTRSYREAFYRREVMTDDAGRFSVRGIKRGSSTVRIETDGYQLYVGTPKVTEETTIEVTLSPSATVKGILKDQHEATVPFARVTLRMNNGLRTMWANTAADGSFSISDVSSGSGTISYSQGQGRLMQEIKLKAGQVLSVKPTMDFGGTVYGRVTGKFGQPLKLWPVLLRSIQLTRESTPKYQQNVWTNEDGYFVLKACNESDYWLQVRDRSGKLREVIKNIVPNQGVIPIKIDVKRLASISGSIEGDAYGISGFKVNLWHKDQNRPFFDDATGRFRFDTVFPGRQTLLIKSVDNKEIAERTFTLKPGEHLDLGVIPVKTKK